MSRAAIIAAVEILATVAILIKKVGPIPAGHVYAQVMGTMSLSQFESIINTLERQRIIKQENFLLTFIADDAISANLERMAK